MSAPNDARAPMRLDWPAEQMAMIRETAKSMGVGPYVLVRGVLLGAVRLGQVNRCFEEAVKAGLVTPQAPIRAAADTLHWRCVTAAEHWSVEVEGHHFDLVRQGSPAGRNVKPGDGWYLFCPDVLDEPRFLGIKVTLAKRDADAFIIRTVRRVQNGGGDDA